VAQKHNASLSKPLAVSQEGWSAPQPVLHRSRRLIGDTPGLTATPRAQNFHNPGRVAKVGLGFTNVRNAGGFKELAGAGLPTEPA
jgi:hypothetical protein